MKEDTRSGNRGFGCLIVKKKKKGDEMSNGGGSLGKHVERKRKKLILSDSEEEEEEELFASPPSKTTSGKLIFRESDVRKEIEIDRKRKPGVVCREDDDDDDDDSRIDRNTFGEAGVERKRSRIDGEKLERVLPKGGMEERREIGRGGVLISKTRVPVVKQREARIESSGNVSVEGRDRPEFDRSNKFSVERGKKLVGMDRQRVEMKKEGNVVPGLGREKFRVHHGEAIRVQGKNGVLKVMPNMKNKVGGMERSFSPNKEEESRMRPKPVDFSDRKSPLSPPLYSGKKLHEKPQSSVATPLSSPLYSERKLHEKSQSSVATALSPSLYSEKKLHEKPQSSVATTLSPSLYSDKKLHEKSQSSVATEKRQESVLKTLSIKHNGVSDRRKQVTETSLSQESKDVMATCNTKKVVSNKKQKNSTSEPCLSNKSKEGEVRRGTGTEKQLLREQIRQMLVNEGWTIDLRPRRNRDYRDSVYISPSGTEYWSITKAYYAFQKQSEDEGRDIKNSGNSSSNPIPEDALSILTRQTRKKMERDIKMQQKAEKGSKKSNSGKKLKDKHVKVKTDSSMNEENKNSNVKQDGKSLKVRIKGNNVVDENMEDLATSKNPTPRKAGRGNSEYKNQNGRALLVRSSSKGQNMDDDGFVLYTGKRTVLSWLIDMETVPMSGKVQYMNKKRTRAMLEGWITRDGIHCRCCSKILTVSKFELHAGSKLHHPFQNIILEKGVSLYQCQLKAWNRQDKSARLGSHFIEVNGDDPNDDTCGICGDGGDLICCDGCPSTFHQSCLNIQMLPSGDWLCPNCSCKFCGGVNGITGREEDTTLCSCTLCEGKYHRVCRQNADASSIDPDSLSISFCEKSCEELFPELQKLLGVKHELESGFSWTLIQRSNLDSDASSRGQWQKAECNSKIAVALSVMDECFLPVIDGRSGVNLIHNVLFNIGSNFNRLNYSGFYTAVLERGDEIIAAASIRIHGTRLAEMPFIGTRHIYRRQGMCRRLLDAIESALCSLKVEKLVIPAISELLHTWTTVFGFKPLEESQRQKLKTLNMLVFPSTDLLQKPLLKHPLNEVNVTTVSVVDAIEPDGNNFIMKEMSDNTDIGSFEPDTCATEGVICDRVVNNRVSSYENGLGGAVASTSNTSSMINSPSDAFIGGSPSVPSARFTPNTNLLPFRGVIHDNRLEERKKNTNNSSVEPKLQNFAEDDSHEIKVEDTEVELDLHSSDETSVQYTTRNPSDYPITASGNGSPPTDGSSLRSNSDWSNQNVHTDNCKPDMVFGEPETCYPDKGVVYNSDMNCVAGSAQIGSLCSAGSAHDTSDMMSNTSDAALGPMPNGPSEESAPDTSFFCQHVGDHDVKFDAETKPMVGSFNESKLQKSTKVGAQEMKVEVTSVEFDLQFLDETSLHHAGDTDTDYPSSVPGNRTGGNHVQSNIDMNKNHAHEVKIKCEKGGYECEKDVVFDHKLNNWVAFNGTGSNDPCGATYDSSDVTNNPCALSTSEESKKQDVSHVKTEASIVSSYLYLSDAGSAYNQPQVAAIGKSSQRFSENIVCHDSNVTSQPYGTISDYNYQDSGGTLVHDNDLKLLQNVEDGSHHGTGEVSSTFKLENGIAPVS